MLPANKGLHPDDTACIKINLGLVMQYKLIPLQRHGIHCRRIYLIGVFTLLLRAIHGDISFLQQYLGLVSVIGEDTDTYACSNKDILSFQYKRFVQCVDDLFCNSRNIVYLSDIYEHNAKLITTQSSYNLALTCCIFNPFSHCTQQRVTCCVPQCVIDDLEAVQIEEQYGQETIMPARPAKFLIQTLKEHRTVSETSDFIVMG